MATLRGTVVLNKISGKPEDAVRNVWHFTTAGAITGAEILNTAAGLSAFYNDIDTLLGSSVSREAGAHRIEFAEVTRGNPGEEDDQVSSLLGTVAMTTASAASNATDLPSEVAICLSFRGDVAGLQEEANGGLTRPKSRRRGRIYLGPWTAGVVEKEAVTNRPFVRTTTRANILSAYETLLLATINTEPNAVHHIVYSRASTEVNKVVSAHVDDAFDIVRSRGEKAVNRSTEAVVQPALVP